MDIDIVPKQGPSGTYIVELGKDGVTLHVGIDDVADFQSRLTTALVEAHRKECDDRVSSLPTPETVFVPPTTSLRWTREGTGSHAYTALAPGGTRLRVRLQDEKWLALVGTTVVGEFDKKRQAQVLCEQYVASNGQARVSFMEEK